jgi:hypothetical protein
MIVEEDCARKEKVRPPGLQLQCKRRQRLLFCKLRGHRQDTGDAMYLRSS